MRLQPLYDLQQDINRLFIAGSKFAKGDPRLQKHIAILNKLGEKAPVFKKLATDIEDLLKTDAQHSAEKLMAISTLLYSVLYTQGELVETDVEEQTHKPNIDIKNVNTEYSYLQLKPVIEALTVPNSGRLEILTDAMERNIFKDSRTFSYLDYALADKYSELADYVEDKIIPSIGKPIIPFLLQNFDYEDKTEHARRLRLLYKFTTPELPQIIDKVLEGSLPVLQAEAVKILSNDPKNEELIIKLADDKNKLVREASYMALAKLNTQTSLEKLKDVYVKNKNKTNLPSIVTAIASSKFPFFFQEIFDQVSLAFQEFIALDKTTDDKVLVDKLERFHTVLEIFENKDYDQVFDFLAMVTKSKEYNSLITTKKGVLENIASSISHTIMGVLNTFGAKKALKFYEQNINEIPETNWKNPFWSNYFYRSLEERYTKEKMFDVFGEVYKKRIIGTSQLYHAFTDTRDNYSIYNNRNVEIHLDRIDKRWIELLYGVFNEKGRWSYEHDQALAIIHAYEPEKCEKLDKLIVDLLKKVQPADTVLIFKLIMERGLPDKFELIYQAMEKFPKNTYYYALYRLKRIDFWGKFPKEYGAKFRKLYEKNKLDIYTEIADEIEGLQK